MTLRRNPAEPLETRSYMQTFAKVRYELSDFVKNSDISLENRRRLEGLREELEQVVRQAISAGDKEFAAKVLARMRYMPHIVVIDGRLAGFSHGDAVSEQAMNAMNEAYKLDPDNTYVWMQTYMRRMQLPPNPTLEQRAAAALKEVEKLIDTKGEAVWPQYYAARAGGYAVLGEYAKARRLYLEAAQFEPKFTDWNKAIDDLKLEMKFKGVAIPADW